MTTTATLLRRIARLLPTNADLWRLGREFYRWRKETGLSDARLIELLAAKHPETDLPSRSRIQALRSTFALFPKSSRLALSHSHHLFAGVHARTMVAPGSKKTEIRAVAVKYLKAARRGRWSVAQMQKSMATDAIRGGKVHHMSGPSGAGGGHFVKRTKRYTVLQGDAAEILSTLKAAVHTVVTSPPYHGLRSYGASKREIGRSTKGNCAEGVPQYIEQVCAVLDAVPLDPLGSMWVVIGESRMGLGGACLGIPERLVLAMQDLGWRVADKVAWVKAGVLPDGTTVGGAFTPNSNLHRLNDAALEWVYRFTRCEPSEAYTDPLAIRIPRRNGESQPYHPGMEMVTALDGRQPPNAWIIPVTGSSEAHCAVFPEALVERPVAMTCPSQVCSLCGSARMRLIEWVAYDDGRLDTRRQGKYAMLPRIGEDRFRRDEGRIYEPRKPVHKGWQDCACRSPVYEPGVVLDPFCGSGTTGAVALRLGRKFIGIDLYAKFCKMTVERLGKQRARRAARTA